MAEENGYLQLIWLSMRLRQQVEQLMRLDMIQVMPNGLCQSSGSRHLSGALHLAHGLEEQVFQIARDHLREALTLRCDELGELGFIVQAPIADKGVESLGRWWSLLRQQVGEKVLQNHKGTWHFLPAVVSHGAAQLLLELGQGVTYGSRMR
jgi:hypothetical protein